MIDLQESPEGVILPVRAKASARCDSLLDTHDGALRVAVTAAPERGKANEAIIRVLADSLNLRRSQITLLTGEASKQKRFQVTGISGSALLSRIHAALEPTVYYEPPEAGT